MNLDDFIEKQIAVNTNALAWWMGRLKQEDNFSEKMWELYQSRITDCQMRLDVLYTARDAKADNPLSK